MPSAKFLRSLVVITTLGLLCLSVSYICERKQTAYDHKQRRLTLIDNQDQHTGNTPNAKQDKFQDGLQNQIGPVAVNRNGNTLYAKQDKFQDGLQNQMGPVAAKRNGNTLNTNEDKFQDVSRNEMGPVTVSRNIGDDGASQNISHIEIPSKHVNECNFTYNNATDSLANSNEIGKKSGRRYKLTLNTLMPRQDDCHFTDDILKRIFLNENILISMKTSLKIVHKVQSTICQHRFR